jgi:FkbM family methyltransferase
MRRWLLRNLVPEQVWPKTIQLDGVQIPLRGLPVSFGVKRNLCKGAYESNERLLINRKINEGDTVLELGGSIGILATILADKVGETGAIISIEASRRLSHHSAKRLAHQKNVSILTGFGFPVSVAPDLVLNSQFHDMGNELAGRVVFGADVVRSDSSVQREIYDISRIAHEFGREPNVLVVDIEGSEAVVLEPNSSIPSYVMHVIIELHPGVYGEDTLCRIVEAFEDFGFIVEEHLGAVYLFTRR